MLYMSQLNHLNRLSTLDRLEIEKYRSVLSSKQDDFQSVIQDWLKEQHFSCENGEPVLLDSYFNSLTSTVLDDSFYVVQYHQALHWLNCGLTQNNILLLLNRIQKQFILYSDGLGSQGLAAGLVHFLSVGESIVATVFQVSRSVERMKMRSQNEIRRLKSAFKLLNQPIPMDVFQAYIDHQKWKSMTFELALGRKVDLSGFETSHTRCDLAKWLSAGGLEKIRESERSQFLSAHEMVHKLGLLAIEESRNNSPEGIIELLFEMEKNSEEIMEILLDVLEKELIENAKKESVRGFLASSLVHPELEKFAAFAKRHDFWLNMVMLQIDDFDQAKEKYGQWVSETLIQEAGHCIQSVARTEDQVFQLAEDRFLIVAMDKESNGAEILAERLRVIVEANEVFSAEQAPLKMTVSCGAVNFWAGLRMSPFEALKVLEDLLKHAYSNGGNQVQHTIIDVIVSGDSGIAESNEIDQG